MVELELGGCRPEPLAHYLKALAILRLVSEQVDPRASGHWRGDRFLLRSTLDRSELVAFVADRFRPTPVIAPWNRGSGFWPKDNRDGMTPIERSTDERFAPYRASIRTAKAVMVRMRLEGDEKAWKKEKPLLIAALRSELPDEALAWLDAALVLTPDGPRFPPLLGTGGNDGHLDFSNNQMKRLSELLLKSQPDHGLVDACIFGAPVSDLKELTIGQFMPSSQGGPNSGPGFSGKGAVNPWDFVLMIEGALVAAASATRRLEAGQSGGELSCPFTVRASGVGYGSATANDENGSHDEIFLPLWSSPAELSSVKALFSEGRVKTVTRSGDKRRAAVTGADFIRALATLGVDRGIDRFVRYGFLLRNGRSFLATPLGVQVVRRQALADVLAPLTPWMDAFSRAAKGDRAPSSWARARMQVERATLDVCTGRAQSLRELLLALAAAERALAGQVQAAEEARVRPVPELPAEQWLPTLEEDSPEFRLALLLAREGIRARIVPIQDGKWHVESRNVTFAEAPLVDNLVATLQRQQIERAQSVGPAPAPPLWAATLHDVQRYLDGRIDDAYLGQLAHALSLLSGLQHAVVPRRPTGSSPGAAFALCALTWGRLPKADMPIPAAPAVLALLAADRVEDATREAARRLTGSGFRPRVQSVPAQRGTGRRLASALAFPLSMHDRRELLVSLAASEPSDLSVEQP